MSRIRVRIDRVALGGLEPAQRRDVVEGLRAELARALAEPATRAASAAPRRTPVLRLGRAVLGPGGPGGRALGAAVARAIARSLHP